MVFDYVNIVESRSKISTKFRTFSDCHLVDGATNNAKKILSKNDYIINLYNTTSNDNLTHVKKVPGWKL